MEVHTLVVEWRLSECKVSSSRLGAGRFLTQTVKWHRPSGLGRLALCTCHFALQLAAALRGAHVLVFCCAYVYRMFQHMHAHVVQRSKHRRDSVGMQRCDAALPHVCIPLQAYMNGAVCHAWRYDAASARTL